MKQFIIYSMVIGGLLVSRGLANAEHDKACKNVHGKVTVVTENGVTVNDKLYKVGKSTRIMKGNEAVKLEKISAGDVVCLDTRGTDDVAAGARPIRKAYSKEQRAFFKANAPAGIGLDDLSILGPITVFKVKFSPEDFNRPLVAELWFYPDASRILELSTKCRPAEAFQVAAEARAFLSQRGVDLSSDQQTKTKTALEYFAAELDADLLQR